MSASQPSPLSLLNRADGQSLSSIIVNGIGGTMLAAWIAGINVIQAVAGVLFLPLEALGIEASNVVTAFVGGIADVFRQGALTTQRALAPGSEWLVGPFTFALAGLAIGALLFVVGEILERPETSNLVPGTFTDWWGLGTEEEPEAEE